MFDCSYLFLLRLIVSVSFYCVQVADNILWEAWGGRLAEGGCEHHHPHNHRHLHNYHHDDDHHHNHHNHHGHRHNYHHDDDHQQDTSATVHYIKLHAPWSLLCRLAEELNLRAPLQVRANSHSHPSTKYFPTSEFYLDTLYTSTDDKCFQIDLQIKSYHTTTWILQCLEMYPVLT